MNESNKYIEAARNRVEGFALDWARMKTFGTILQNDGTTVIVSFNDQESCLKSAMQRLEIAAVALLREMADRPLPERKSLEED